MPSDAPRGPFTLSFDIGGTGLKASVLDSGGKMTHDRDRVPTPYPCPPKVMVDALAGLAKDLPAYDRISAGFPGVVRDGKVVTAPHYGTDIWAGFPLAKALETALGKPARVLNDADMQGLAAIHGKGLEMVVTLGTGFGSAIFKDGELMPHLELAHHPVHGKKTYNEYIGDHERKRIGKKRWNRRVEKVLDIVRTLVNFDHLYIGGGNAKKLDFELPGDVTTVSNDLGILGGIALWADVDRAKGTGTGGT